MFLYSNGTLNTDVNFWAGYGSVFTVLIVIAVNIGAMVRKSIQASIRLKRMKQSQKLYRLHRLKIVLDDIERMGLEY